jgi:hypothetical protein
MLDSPITLLLLGISAASAIASYAAHRRRKQRQAALPTLSILTDADLMAALAALSAPGPDGTNTPVIAQQHAAPPARHSISVTHPASEMREADHDSEVRRRITLLVIEELERRGLPPPAFR